MEVHAVAAAAGVSKTDVIAGLKRFIPIAELIAKTTENTVDDAAVAFVKALLESLGS